MKENKKGAGRKPLPLMQKKEAVTIYPSKGDIVKFGSKKKMGEAVLKFISNYGNEIKTEYFPDTSGVFQDLTKPTNEIKPFEQSKTNYEVKIPPKPENLPIGSFEAFRKAILETTMTKEVESIMREVKAALMPNKQKQQLEAIAKEHSKDFFTD